MDTSSQISPDLQILYVALPDTLKDIIFAPETTESYDKLAAKFQLDPKQRDTLSAETTFLFLGIRNPQQLVSALAKGLNVDRAKASLIAQDLNRELFYKVKDDLKELYAVPADIPLSAIPVPPIAPAIAGVATDVARPTPPTAPLAPKVPDEEVTPKAHIGNIFEEKLGGAFRVKSDAVAYTAPSTATTASLPVPPAPPKAPTPPPATPDPYRELPV